MRNFLNILLLILEVSFIFCTEYEVYIKGYITINNNDTKYCSHNSILITLICTNSKSDELFKKSSEFMDVQKDNVNNSRCSFEFFTHLKDINHNSYIAPSIFKFIDIKQFFTSLKSFISFLHISINTKFTNGKKRFQSIVYPNGEKTPNSKFIQGRSMIKGYKSVVFTVNKIQTIKMVFQDEKYKSKKTFMEENELYNFVHSLIAKDKVTKNFTTLKKQASKYSKDIKNSFVISRRFNIWVSFINYIRSKNEALTKLSSSPFY